MTIDPDQALRALFVQEARQHVDALQTSFGQLEREPDDVDTLDDAFRAAHSIKGMAAALEYDDLALLVHAIEDELDAARGGRRQIDAARIAALRPAAEQIVLQLDVIGSGAAPISPADSDGERRLEPIDVVFRRLPRLVEDLAGTLRKSVDLRVCGSGTLLDQAAIGMLGDLLLQLVRNALDHGVEHPEERLAAGKPARGAIFVSASTTGDSVFVRVSDDGAGVAPDELRRAAVTRGLATTAAATAMTDEQALQLCFAPGLSTRAEASIVSGRGVGLDIVRSRARALGGDATITSSDHGTCITVRLPQTPAAEPAGQLDAA